MFYPDYVAMRIREQTLLCEEVEIREMIKDPEFRKNWTSIMQHEFDLSCRRMVIARRKLDEIEKVLRNDLKSGKTV